MLLMFMAMLSKNETFLTRPVASLTKTPEDPVPVPVAFTAGAG
jgi:hypothetical protein